MKLLPEVLNSENVEAVHDLRVCSRRLQQVLVTMFPSEQEGRASQVIRAIRQARRGLSGWRDCDVVMALLDKRLRRLRDPDEQQAWRVVRDYLARRREKEIRRARRRLAKRKLFILAQRTKDLMNGRELNSATNVDVASVASSAVVAGFIKTAASNWLAALTAAADSGNPANVHHFRIKTKKLRYCKELAQDLGYEEVPVPLNWLKSLQDRLGRWHDRVQLARIAMEALSKADLLLTAPRPVSLLLKRLARELLSEATKVKSLLAAVKDDDELLQLETWVASHCEETTPEATKQHLSAI
jgi:CHAD domain-containing protein